MVLLVTAVLNQMSCKASEGQSAAVPSADLGAARAPEQRDATMVRRDELPAPANGEQVSSAAQPSLLLGHCTFSMPQAEPDVALRASASGPVAAALRRCAEAGAPSEARLMVKFAIEADGCVRDVTIASEPSSPPVEKCVAALFSALRFARPADGTAVVVRYPVIVTRPR
jgi:hypothetical protein